MRMRKRSRTIAGFVGTATFVFSLVAGIQASVCAAEVAPGSSAIPAGPMPMAAEHDASMSIYGEYDCTAQHGERDGIPHCPFMPLAAGPSCTMAFSLPASIHGVTSSIIDVRDVSMVVNKPDLLLATALFHPPKS